MNQKMSYSSQQQLKKTIAARLKAAGRLSDSLADSRGTGSLLLRRCHPHSSRHSRGRKFIPCRTACPVHRICTVQVKQDLREYLAAWIQKY